jgi:thiosulfate dehydrogenase
MPLLTRAADPERGRRVYVQHCAECHGERGEGIRQGSATDALGYLVPPLWGADSFNDGAGMNRLITIANFVHSNMPNGVNWADPLLSEADAWDAAAYVVSQPRPHKADLAADFPDKLKKPVDTPYGPYADQFSEIQHKYGPFQPILAEDRRLAAEQQQRK